MKKNGFVFVETIVVIAVLATALLVIYGTFTTILTNEKERIYYDDPIYLYRTYYILDFLESYNVTSFIETKLSPENTTDSEKLLVEFSCKEPTVIKQGSPIGYYCEKIINAGNFNVEHIYFTYFDTYPITQCTGDNEYKCGSNESMRSLSINARKYLKTLGGKGKDGYRIIIEYKVTTNKVDHFYYATAYVPFGVDD